MLSYCLPFPHFPWVLGILLCIRANQEPTRLAFSPAHGGGGWWKPGLFYPSAPRPPRAHASLVRIGQRNPSLGRGVQPRAQLMRTGYISA